RSLRLANRSVHLANQSFHLANRKDRLARRTDRSAGATAEGPGMTAQARTIRPATYSARFTPPPPVILRRMRPRLPATLGLLISLLFTHAALAQGGQAVIEPTHADVRYGPHDRNVLDVYQADTKAPAPVLIHFHGGGWVMGDKRPIGAAP